MRYYKFCKNDAVGIPTTYFKIDHDKGLVYKLDNNAWVKHTKISNGWLYPSWEEMMEAYQKYGIPFVEVLPLELLVVCGIDEENDEHN